MGKPRGPYEGTFPKSRPDMSPLTSSNDPFKPSQLQMDFLLATTAGDPLRPWSRIAKDANVDVSTVFTWRRNLAFKEWYERNLSKACIEMIPQAASIIVLAFLEGVMERSHKGEQIAVEEMDRAVKILDRFGVSELVPAEVQNTIFQINVVKNTAVQQVNRLPEKVAPVEMPYEKMMLRLDEPEDDDNGHSPS